MAFGEPIENFLVGGSNNMHMRQRFPLLSALFIACACSATTARNTQKSATTRPWCPVKAVGWPSCASEAPAESVTEIDRRSHELDGHQVRVRGSLAVVARGGCDLIDLDVRQCMAGIAVAALDFKAIGPHPRRPVIRLTDANEMKPVIQPNQGKYWCISRTGEKAACCAFAVYDQEVLVSGTFVRWQGDEAMGDLHEVGFIQNPRVCVAGEPD